MENPEIQEQSENFIATIKEDIESAPEKIAQEIERGSGNDWLAALTSRITVARGFAELAEKKGQLSPEKTQQVRDIADAMVMEIGAYRQQKEIVDNVPEEVKSALLAELRSILEVL